MRADCRFPLVALAALLAAGCGGGLSGPEPAAATFVIRLRDLPPTEEFRVRSTSPEFNAQARAQLQLPVTQRQRFVAGPILAGNGGHNLNWSWHIGDPTLVQTSIELCDGRPSMVEADLGYWLGTVKSFCPWSSYVHAELP